MQLTPPPLLSHVLSLILQAFAVELHTSLSAFFPPLALLMQNVSVKVSALMFLQQKSQSRSSGHAIPLYSLSLSAAWFPPFFPIHSMYLARILYNIQYMQFSRLLEWFLDTVGTLIEDYKNKKSTAQINSGRYENYHIPWSCTAWKLLQYWGPSLIITSMVSTEMASSNKYVGPRRQLKEDFCFQIRGVAMYP